MYEHIIKKIPQDIQKEMTPCPNEETITCYIDDLLSKEEIEQVENIYLFAIDVRRG